MVCLRIEEKDFLASMPLVLACSLARATDSKSLRSLILPVYAADFSEVLGVTVSEDETVSALFLAVLVPSLDELPIFGEFSFAETPPPPPPVFFFSLQASCSVLAASRRFT